MWSCTTLGIISASIFSSLQILDSAFVLISSLSQNGIREEKRENKSRNENEPKTKKGLKGTDADDQDS